MSNFIANAQIVVQADTKPFAAEVKGALSAVERRKIFVKVLPNTVGFTKELNRQLRDVKPTPVRVRVVPDLTGFRTAVRTAALDAVKNLQIPASVIPAAAGRATGGAAAGAGGVVDKRASEAQLAVNKAVEAGVAARRKLGKEFSATDKQMLRETRTALQLKTAIAAVNAAAVAGDAALSLQAEELFRVAVAAEAATVATGKFLAKEAAFKAGGAAGGAAGIEAAAAAQLAADIDIGKKQAAAIKENDRRDREFVKTHIAAIKANEKVDKEAAAEFKRIQLGRIDALREEIAALTERARVAATAAQLDPRTLVTRPRDILGQPVPGGGEAIGDEALERQKSFLTAEEEIARSRAAGNKARRQTIGLSKIETGAEARLAAARAILRTTTEGLVAAEIARDEALGTGVVSINTAAAEELRLAKQRQETALETVAAAEAQVVAAGRIGAGRRALEAFGANLVQLRGAALSAQGAFVATAAAAIAVTKAIQSAAAFQSELNVFRVTAGATADQMEIAAAAARELGRDITLPGVGAQDAAEALTSLSKAGLSVGDSIDGARGVLQLATAASIDNAQATELAASALNAFGLRGIEATHVADVLANAANAAQGSIVDIGVALQQSAGVARQAGLSLEQTVAVLTLFARSGLKGSDAGTSFRTMLIRLINPTKKAQEQIARLGLHIRDAQGNINLNVLDEFAKKTRDLTNAQRDQALAIIFGQDAIRGAAILARAGSSELSRQVTELNKSGTAAELAAARMTGFAGSIENLKNQLSSTGIALGNVLTPSLGGLVDVIALVVGGVGDLTEKLVELRDLAQKPFEFVFRFKSEGGPGGGGGLGAIGDDVEKKFADTKDKIKKDLGDLENLVFGFGPGPTIKGFLALPEQMAKIQAGLEDLTGFDLVNFPTLKQAREEILEIVAAVNAANAALDKSAPGVFPGGDPEAINKAVVRFKELREELKGGTEDERLLGEFLDKFIVKLQNASGKTKFPVIVVPKNLTEEAENEIKKVRTFSEDEVKFVQQTLGEGYGKGGKISAEEFNKALKKSLGKDNKEVALGQSKLFAQGFIAGITPNMTLAGAIARDALLTGFNPAVVGDTAAGVFMDHFTTGLDVKAAAAAKDKAAGFAKGAVTFRNELRGATRQAVTQADNQALGTERRRLDAQADKDQAAEIAALQTRIRVRDREIAKIMKAAGASGGAIIGGRPELTDAQLKAVTDAKKDRQQAVDEITSIQEEQARELKEKRDDADAKFLAALERGRTPFARRVEAAQATEDPQDNITSLLAFRKRLQNEVDAVRKGVKDGETKAKELARLSDELFQNSLDINAARKTRDEAFANILSQRGTALRDLGLATDNFRLVLRGFDFEIDGARQTVAKARELAREAKGVAKAIATIAWDQAKAALAKVKNDRQDFIDEAKSSVLEDAFRFAEAKENKGLMLLILDRQIAEVTKAIGKAKTLADLWRLRADREELINKKKEILKDELEKGNEGTTVFDLLKQSVDAFNANAGSLIGADQPFAGPTGFTADIAQFLKRRKPIGIGTGRGAGQAGTRRLIEDEGLGKVVSTDKQVASNNALIAAIDRWIATVNNQASSGAGGANGSLSSAAVTALGARGSAMKRWFADADNARRYEEAGG